MLLVGSDVTLPTVPALLNLICCLLDLTSCFCLPARFGVMLFVGCDVTLTSVSRTRLGLMCCNVVRLIGIESVSEDNEDLAMMGLASLGLT